jgi:hypothetical protein
MLILIQGSMLGEAHSFIRLPHLTFIRDTDTSTSTIGFELAAHIVLYRLTLACCVAVTTLAVGCETKDVEVFGIRVCK